MEENNTLGRLREQERLKRRELILQAATELFSTQSFSKVSIRDIAKQAGISPALIYRHFDDRDELFVEVFLVQSERMTSVFAETLENRDESSLYRIGEKFVSYLLKHELFFQMMTHFMLDAAMKESGLQKFNDNMRRLLTIFDEVFINMGRTEDIRLHSQAFFAALNGIMITYRNYPGRSEAEIRKHIQALTKVIAEKFQQS